MPTPADKMREKWVLYLDALNKTRSHDRAVEQSGIKSGTIRQWRLRYPDEFGVMEEMALGGRLAAAMLPAVKQEAETPEFPVDDFLRWRELCCAYVDQRSPTKAIVRAQNNWYQRDAYKRLSTSNRLVVVLPPGHIKTTFFSIEYPAWSIMRDRNQRITAIQKNENEAKKLVQSVQERLSDLSFYDYHAARLVEQGDEPIINPLSTWFGHAPFKPNSKRDGETWGAQAFKVKGRTSGEKDHTMEAKGVGGQVQGVRADKIILDDIQDPEQGVKSPQDSRDKLGWVERVVLGRITDYQQLVVLANYFAPDDFAHLLVREHPEFEVVEYPALIDSSIDPDIPAGEVRPLCPEFWTIPALEAKRKEVKEKTWYYTWMQEEGSYEDATFKREVLEDSRDQDYVLGQVPSEVTDVYLGVDPATEGHCAMIVWGLDRRSKQRFLIDVFNEKGMRNWDNVVAQIVHFAGTFSPRKVIVEGNNTQKAFINSDALIRGVKSAGSKLAIYQTVTGTGARAEQTNFDITTIGGLFDGGLITLPYGGTYEQQGRVDAYIDQLVAWRTDEEGRSLKHLKRDMVMATLFAESEAFLVAKKDTERPRVRRRPVPRFATSKDGTRFSWQQRPQPPKRIKTLSDEEIRRIKAG